MKHSRCGTKAALSLAAVIASYTFGAPMQEARADPARTTAHVTKKAEAEQPIKTFSTENLKFPTAEGYSPDIDPLELSPRLRAIADSITGTHKEMVAQILKKLAIEGEEGVRYLIDNIKTKDGILRPHAPPLTAGKTLENGGDCSELALIAVAVMKYKNIPGGAAVVKLDKDDPNVFHIVAFASIDGKDIAVDLTKVGIKKEIIIRKEGSREIPIDVKEVLIPGGRPDSVLEENYKVLERLTHEEARSIWHHEWADYFHLTGQHGYGIAANRRSLELFERSPYVHERLATELNNLRFSEEALVHMRRAAELNPSAYAAGTLGARRLRKVELNVAIERGLRALDTGRFSECVQIFESVLNGPPSPEMRSVKRVLKTNLRTCRHNARITGQ